MDNFLYDAFISYSHKDEEWVVTTLLPALEKVGLKVCIDFRDFEAGKASLFNMQDSIQTSRHLVLVITRNWLESEWALFESLLGATQDPATLQKKIIPLLCEVGVEKEINPFISLRTWINFIRKDRLEIAWNQLYSALGRPNAVMGRTNNIEKSENTSRENWNLVHPYLMPPNFTGRLREREVLSAWLNENNKKRSPSSKKFSLIESHPLFILRGLGGFGKSALAWYWLSHDVDRKLWPNVVWWSFYEGDSNFDRFLTETIRSILGKSSEIPIGSRVQAEKLLELLQRPGILIVMDGFERALRAFGSMNAAYQGDENTTKLNNDSLQRGCISASAEFFLHNFASLGMNIQSRVLMTTRLRPSILETYEGMLLSGCLEKVLSQMEPEDAVEFFQKQGIRGSLKNIKDVCQSYGYHPLSLRLLAGLILTDLKFPGDIQVAKSLEVIGELKQHQHHVLEQTYESLSTFSQKLLNEISCNRFAMDYDEIKTLTDKIYKSSPDNEQPLYETHDLDSSLHELLNRGLLNCNVIQQELSKDTKGRKAKYDLHPIVRRYVYDRLTISERRSIHTQMVDYFEAVPKIHPDMAIKDLSWTIELYHHTLRAGRINEAIKIYQSQLAGLLYYKYAAYQTITSILHPLFSDPDVENSTFLGDANTKVWILNELALSYGECGQPVYAEKLLKISINELKKENSVTRLATILANLVQSVQIPIGKLEEAKKNILQCIDLYNSVNDVVHKAIGHRELGYILALCGKWDQSVKELSQSEQLLGKNPENNVFLHEYVNLLIVQAMVQLLLIRSNRGITSSYTDQALSYAIKAETLLKDCTENMAYYERDFIRVNWILGCVEVANHQTKEATVHLEKALAHCKAIGILEVESQIILELARLYYDKSEYDEAFRLAKEALNISNHSGYKLVEADIYIFLARYSLIHEKDKKKARENSELARSLAYCGESPEYVYKVAYNEAIALLKESEMINE
jgi:tetratricopeptide (TPR) repeat protein